MLQLIYNNKQVFKFWSLFFLIIYITIVTASDPRNLFPEIPGWSNTGNVQTYQPENLFEYINGAADLYLTYDFQELLVGEYINDQHASVIVEIYRHDSPEQAFGIYSQERPEEGNYIPVGAEGYVEGPMLNFINDIYYVKISGSDLTGSPEEVIKSVAHVTSKQIGKEPPLPRELSCFPKKDLKPHSEKYIHRNFLGYEFLHSAFVAEYQSENQASRLFLIKGKDQNDCIQMLKTWQKKNGIDTKQIVENRYYIEDRYSGKIGLEWNKNYIWGSIGLTEINVLDESLKYLGNQVKDVLLKR